MGGAHDPDPYCSTKGANARPPVEHVVWPGDSVPDQYPFPDNPFRDGLLEDRAAVRANLDTHMKHQVPPVTS